MTLDHAHVWHGDRPSNVRCAVQDCDAEPKKADIERVRADAVARRAIQRTLVMTHERP